MWLGQVFKYGGHLEQVCSRECSCKILVSLMLSFHKGHNEPTRWGPYFPSQCACHLQLLPNKNDE